MSEKNNTFEFKEHCESTLRPSLLDVVKIDGRWAQVCGAGNVVVFLDDRTEVMVDWNNYTCQQFDKYNKASIMTIWVRDLLEDKQISRDEFDVIRWGQGEDQSAKIFVTVFGIYTKK